MIASAAQKLWLIFWGFSVKPDRQVGRSLIVVLLPCASMVLAALMSMFSVPIAGADNPDDALDALMMGGSGMPTPSEFGATPSSPTTSTPRPVATTRRCWFPSPNRFPRPRTRSASPTCRPRWPTRNWSIRVSPISSRDIRRARRSRSWRRRTSWLPGSIPTPHFSSWIAQPARRRDLRGNGEANLSLQ